MNTSRVTRPGSGRASARKPTVLQLGPWLEDLQLPAAICPAGRPRPGLPHVVVLLVPVLLAMLACAPAGLLPLTAGVPAAGLASYGSALRPEFAGDLNAFEQATRYAITLTVAPDLSAVSGDQTVHFVNREDQPLDAIYFRLYPN